MITRKLSLRLLSEWRKNMNMFKDMLTEKMEISKARIIRAERRKKMMSLPVIIYGFGNIGQGLYKTCLPADKVNVVAVCDNGKIGESYDTDKKIVSFADAYERLRSKELVVIVCSRFCHNEIIEELKEYGIKEDYIIDGDDLYCNYASYYLTDSEKYKSMVEEHNEELMWLYNTVADEKSRETMENIFRFVLSNNDKYIEKIYEPNQYFPSDIISIKDEVFMDCGGFIGDTVKELLDKYNENIRKIYTFEPIPEQNQVIEKLLKERNVENIVTLIKKGVSDKNEVLRFSNNKSGSRVTDKIENAIEVPVCRIDDVVKEPVTFIKMDIEGSELAALHGACNTITANKPKLAICIYHKPEDWYQIPQYILSLNTDYKIYIRHHSKGFTETVLYAI